MKKILFPLLAFLLNTICLGQAGLPDQSLVAFTAYEYNCMDMQSDNKLLITKDDGSDISRVRRFLPNGQVDPTFTVAWAFGGASYTNYNRYGILDIQTLPDDRILVGGAFHTFYNQTSNISTNANLARLLPNGVIDPTFHFNLETYIEAITSIFINSAGEIIVGGHHIFARILEDGAIDETFSDSYFVDLKTIETIDQFANNDYLVGGNFTTGGVGSYMYRCFPDGNPDPSWTAGNGFNGVVRKVIIQPDQKILVLGDFTQFNGVPISKICRLNEDGTLDTTFGLVISGNPVLNDFLLQPDGKIVIGGNFWTFNGYSNRSTVRINANGSLDMSINPFAGAGNSVRTVALQNDGKIIIGGQFTSYYGIDRNRIARINGGECTTVQGTDIITACGSHTWIDGNEYTSNNNTATFLFEGAAQNGCDSLVTLNLTIHQISSPPTAINSLYNYCLGGSTVLEVTGGSLSDGAQWEWFSGSCNATPIGTGSTLEVSPNANTSYYARASQGTVCPPSDCEAVVVNLPTTSTNLALDGEQATCFVNQNGWVHFYNNAGNLLASIQSNGQDLGNVQVTSHVANSPYQSAACDDENNASFFQANLQRTFVITPENQPTSPVQVRLYVLDDEITAYQTAALATTQNPHDDIATISDLNLTKVSGGTSSGDPADFCGSNAIAEFILQDASGNINDAATGMTGFAQTSYLEFTIGSFSEFFPMNANNSALPVSLTNFSASCLGETIGIQWTTASEFNASHYIVQSSRDGFVWQDLARISAVGTTNQTSNYSYEDKNVGALTYYRLVQIDNDGQQEVFGPISSNCEVNNNLMTVHPNPSSDNFMVVIQTNQHIENAVVELMDLSGRVILSQTKNINAGSTMLNIDVQSIQPGAYVIRMKGENDKFAPIRVVKL